MHIASAVNKKVLSIFGPTNPLRKAPLHKESKYLWNDQNIYNEKADIYGLNFITPKTFMERIRVEDVLKAVDEMV